MTLERAILGVDGNCGFALLGEDIQAGEAEFVKIESEEPVWTAAWERAANKACNLAYLRLHGRLGSRVFTYALHPSHPRYLP